MTFRLRLLEWRLIGLSGFPLLLVSCLNNFLETRLSRVTYCYHKPSIDQRKDPGIACIHDGMVCMICGRHLGTIQKDSQWASTPNLQANRRKDGSIELKSMNKLDLIRRVIPHIDWGNLVVRTNLPKTQVRLQ